MSFTSHYDAMRTIGARIDARLGASAPADAFTVQYDNEDGTLPENGSTAGKPFIRAAVRPGTTTQLDLGNIKVFRTPGVIIFQLFTRSRTGTKQAWQTVDAIVTHFRSTVADGITYRTPYSTVVGADNGWWQVNVTCPFHYDILAPNL